MFFSVVSRRPVRAALLTAIAMLASAEANAIEMFTYFGDGSRIGLPSLEVPVEAYPGIPLRSDRLRARRRAMRMGTPAATAGRQVGPSQTITIRAMPEAVEAPRPTPAPQTSGRGTTTHQAKTESVPVAPAPEEVSPPSEQ
jgi:hypothetical protein